ncbi:hypothetical protein BH09ACT11_BH09ACT11_09540 [soil metagenome]
MALSQSALSELLDAFRTGDGVDMIRDSVRFVLQELIEAEATEVIGAGRYERTEARVTDATGAGRSCSRRRPATWSCGSPNFVEGRTSPPSLSLAAASTRRSTRW